MAKTAASKATYNLLAVGDRIVVEFDENSWYAGTVKRATSKSYKVCFDYGETQNIGFDESPFKKIEGLKSFTKSLTSAKVQSLIDATPEGRIAKAKRKAEERALEAARLVAEVLAAKRAVKVRKVRVAVKKVLSDWLTEHQVFRGNKPTIELVFDSASPNGCFIIKDNKINILAYTQPYEVSLYAVPAPTQNLKPGDVDLNDDIEFAKENINCREFDMARFMAFLHKFVPNHGFKFQYLVTPKARRNKTKPLEVENQKAEVPKVVQEPIIESRKTKILVSNVGNKFKPEEVEEKPVERPSTNRRITALWKSSRQSPSETSALGVEYSSPLSFNQLL